MRANRARFFATTAAVLLILGAGSMPAAAQVQPGGDGGRPAHPEGLISVQFGGGTVADYVNLLRGAMKPQPSNIALSESAAGAVLPQVQLDAVTLGTALEAIQFIAPTGTGEQWVIQPLTNGDEPPAFAVTLVRNRPMGMEPAVTSNVPAADQDRILQVFSIKELIDPSIPGGLTSETVLSAVEVALRMAGEGSKQTPAEVKFHPDSGLIILEAPPQQVGAIEGLLQRMRSDAERQQDRAERRAKQRLDNEMALRIAAAKVQNSQAREEFARQALDKMTQLHQSGNVSDDDVRKAQMDLVNADSDFQITSAELETAKARIDADQTAAASASPSGGDADALRAQVSQLQQQVAALQAKIKELEAKKK